MASGDSREPMRRVELLAFRLFERGLSADESAELDRLLREVDGAAEAYARYADTHAMLAFAHGEVKSATPVERDIDREVFDEIIALARQERERSEVEARADAMLQAERDATREAGRRTVGTEAKQTGQRVLVIPTWLVYTGGLAAAALIALAVYPLLKPASPTPSSGFVQEQSPEAEQTPATVAGQAAQPEDEFVTPPAVVPNATLARSYNAAWQGVQGPAEGKGLGDRRYRLTEGFVELTFADGASVIVQAPATLRVASASELELDRGLLKATVPPGAEGFTVVTPTGRLVDLGTEFGVEVHAGGRTTMDVMTGKVRAELPNAGISQELVAGQGTSLLKDSDKIEVESAQGELYPADWSLIRTGLRTYDAGVQLFSLPSSVEVGRFENDNRIVAFAEQRGLTLVEDLKVSITEPGRYERMPQYDMQVIPAGTTIDSYLLHFDASGRPSEIVDATATFVFDRPIIGLIVSHRGLAASDELLAADGVAYPPASTPTRGLEGREHQYLNELLDEVQFEGKSLTIRMGTTGLLDQVRVILEAQPASGAEN